MTDSTGNIFCKFETFPNLLKSNPFSDFWIGNGVSSYSVNKDVDPESWYLTVDTVMMLHDYDNAIQIIHKKKGRGDFLGGGAGSG